MITTIIYTIVILGAGFGLGWSAHGIKNCNIHLRELEEIKEIRDFYENLVEEAKRIIEEENKKPKSNIRLQH